MMPFDEGYRDGYNGSGYYNPYDVGSFDFYSYEDGYLAGVRERQSYK